MSKRIYISGKITGLMPEVAAELFALAAEEIRAQGNVPLNPMEIWPQDAGWQWHDYLSDNVRFLLKMNVDELYMLPNWQESKGAGIEHMIAQTMGIHIVYAPGSAPTQDTGTDYNRPGAVSSAPGVYQPKH